MNLEKIVDIYGKSFDKTLLIKRSLIAGETSFKAFKTYTISLYEKNKCVKMDKPYSIDEIFTTKVTDKITDDTKNKVIDQVEQKFLKELFDYYGSKSISDIDN